MDKLLRYIRPTKVLDVGAHIGNFTKDLLSHIPDCQVVLVEPNPNCEQYLKLIGQKYDMVALSNYNGIAELHVENINPIGTGASLYKENTEWYKEGAYHKVSVPTKTLNQCNYFNGSIDLIKLDAQGSELDIIKGGEDIIKNAKFVLIEVSLLQYNEGAPLMDSVMDKMVELEFVVVDVIEYHQHQNIIFQLDLLFKNLN